MSGIASVLIKYIITAKRRGLIINASEVSRVGDSNMEFLAILDGFVNLVPMPNIVYSVLVVVWYKMKKRHCQGMGQHHFHKHKLGESRRV